MAFLSSSNTSPPDSISADLEIDMKTMCNISRPSPATSKRKSKVSITPVTIPSLSSYICPASAESPITPEHDDDEKVGFVVLLNQLDQQEQNCVYAKNGYKKLDKISVCLQGDMYKAMSHANGEYVAIKRVSKELLAENITIDDDGMTFCVSENLVKEAAILQYLTVRNRPLGDYIINFVDLFEDEDNYFLVVEYIESETNLKQFVQQAHGLLEEGRLKLKDYQKAIKYIMWQLVVTIKWLHDDMNCCHLDLCVENIMLKNCNFIQQKDGMHIVNPKLTIKICDFGVSEVMNGRNFECNKFGLSLENEAYLSPRTHSEQTYDARSNDVWCLGMILFECLSGTKPYDPCEIWMGERRGYWALHRGYLKAYLVKMKLIKYWTNDSFSLLLSMLQSQESKRCNAMQVLKHGWFKLYFKGFGPLFFNL